MHLQCVHDQPLHTFTLPTDGSIIAFWAAIMLGPLVLDQDSFVIKGAVTKETEWSGVGVGRGTKCLFPTHGSHRTHMPGQVTTWGGAT
mmetsp:Transcript_72333/g.126485  ORF Transcript_72333/g.126485 Transcript_72333/m.126485 type:complete len:88 (+) Transcript_72333:482-745(+)